MTAPKTCTYDNPLTLCREIWTDGKLVAQYRLEDVGRTAFYDWHVEANVGPWKPGQVVGNPNAASSCIPRL